MSLCILASGKLLALAVTAFTLRWEHSVERSAWEEDWAISPRGLVLVEARVKGSGAGMEPGEGASLHQGWWRWRPDLAPQPALTLAASGATGRGWALCHAGGCGIFGTSASEPVRLSRCL